MSDAVTNQEPATAGKPAEEELHRIQRLLNTTQQLTGWVAVNGISTLGR